MSPMNRQIATIALGDLLVARQLICPKTLIGSTTGYQRQPYLFQKVRSFDAVKSTFMCLLICALASAAAGRAFAAAVYTGAWSLSANNFTDGFNDGQSLTSITSQVSKSKDLGAMTGSRAECDIFLDAHPGHISISANTVAALGVNYDHTTATSSAQAFFTLSDTMHLITPPSTHEARMTAFWKVDGFLATTADGERSVGNTPAALNAGGPSVLDFVDVAATSSLKITGSGLPAAPAAAAHDSDSSTWAFNQDAINSRNTFDIHIDDGMPSEIPITLIFPPGASSLPYIFTLRASAGSYVASFDPVHTGKAEASVFFGHTFSWGGVTSVTDAVTGQPITDWTLTSDSGFDYANPAPPVPEPSSATLFVIGGVMASAARGRCHLGTTVAPRRTAVGRRP
jgi:hypothetical protein